LGFLGARQQKCPREAEPAAAEFEDSLARQQMDSVSERLCSPEKAILYNRISFSPVVIAVSFAKLENRDKWAALFTPEEWWRTFANST
jgi:hypothetical protein